MTLDTINVKTDYENYQHLVQTQGLVPNQRVAGEFTKVKKGLVKDKMRFLFPSNWIFHDQIVEKVLEGDYFGIMPYCAEFVTTMNCSNRCEIPCGYKLQKIMEEVWEKNNSQNPRVHMQNIEFAKNLLDRLINGGVKGMIFTGGGEPFLFKGLEDLVARASEQGVDSVVYTNGNAVSEKRIRKLIQAQPLLVRVSLNAGTKEVYDRFHMPMNKKGAFQRTLNTIKSFAEASIQNPRMSLGIGVVINEINRHDLVETAQRIREIIDKTKGGIEFVTYRPAFNYCGISQLQSELLDETYEIVERDVKRELSNTGIKVLNIVCRYDALKQDTRNYDKCRATNLYAELSPRGTLHLCCERNCHRDYVIGDLTQSTLEEIWKSKRRKSAIDWINASSCATCPPACKPHETNKQFNKIEELRKAGEFYKVRVWIEEQRKMPKPKMVNF